MEFTPDDLPVYESLVSQLTTTGDWKEMDRLTRRFLHALAMAGVDSVSGRPREDVELELWRRVRFLRDEKLGDLAGARDAAQFIARHPRAIPTDYQVFANILMRLGEQPLSALEGALAKDPKFLPALHELMNLRHVQRGVGEALCVASVLAFLNALTPAERSLYDSHRQKNLPARVPRLDPSVWSLLSRDPRPEIDAFIEAIVAASYRVSAPALLEDRDPRFLPEQLEYKWFRSAFAWCVEAFGLPRQTHFADFDDNAPSPKIAGGELDGRRQGGTLRSLLFVAGRQVAFHRPSHLLLFHCRTIRELNVLVWAAVLACDKSADIPEPLREVCSKMAKQLLESLDDRGRDRLLVAHKRLVSAQPRLDMRRWKQEQDLVAARAGLLMCADLSVARDALAAEPRSNEELGLDEVMNDLCAFASTEAYAKLRARLA